MREKIERLSKGEFEYALPELTLSEGKLELHVEAGKQYEGCFQIHNSKGLIMKGALYSSHRQFSLLDTTFQGSEATVHYRFDAMWQKPGDCVQGDVTIISDCGERSIPFIALIEAAYCSTTLGRVKDLFQFANLARMDWAEAKKVFRSEEFERVILKNDSKYKEVYRILKKNISTSQALEEFLIAVHKKSKIELIIDKSQLEYDYPTAEFMDKLILTKNNWGYAEIRVSTDAPFLQLEQKFLWADRFIGNTHQVSFLVIPSKLRPGKNYGRIWIKTVYQTLIVEVVCRCPSNRTAGEDVITEKKTWFEIMNSYLDFRMDRNSLTEYVADTGQRLNRFPAKEGSYIHKLMNIHLMLLSGKTKAAESLLGELAKEESTLRRKSIKEYAAYLYLKALCFKDEATIKQVTDSLRSIYNQGNYDWLILWFLLYTDNRYIKNLNRKLMDIREQFVAGCHSPILYYEAVMIMNEEAYLLRELTEFEKQVMNFGIKNGILSKEIALQYSYLAGKLKSFDPIIFKGLTQLYKQYGETAILSAICSMLIKGLKKSNRYYKWFQLGVEKQLRITELYEYYMYSVDEDMLEPLPQSILLYFIYNSSLNDRKRAFLYANIIRYKDKLATIYRSYMKRMEVFALKQLEVGSISPNLSVLYREFLYNSSISQELAGLLPRVLFYHELLCTNPNMVSVAVYHRETGIEETQALQEKRAYIQLYSGNTDIFLVDNYGNRYTVSVEYSLKPLLHLEEKELEVLDNKDSQALLLHILERYQNHRILSSVSMEVRKQILQLTGIQEDYLIDCLTTLIYYYYEHYDEEQLTLYLSYMDIRRIRESDRVRFLESLIMLKNYEKAFDIIREYGFDNLSIQWLLRLCSGWIACYGEDTKQELIVNLCFYLFSQGKYDEAILTYLVIHYYGPTPDMLRLWKSAKGFELDIHELEERLLVQILFTEDYRRDGIRVFRNYYRNVSNHMLVRAFISYHAYQYMVHGLEARKELFEIMRRELNYEENDICLLAWLKYNSGKQELSEGETNFISININRLERKGVVFPFYMNYEKLLPLPHRMLNKTYIEYSADPSRQVYLHYRIIRRDVEAGFITERLPNVFQGIHVKEFTLFYHEVLQYYITEELAGETNTSETYEIIYDKEATPQDESKYNQINRMLMAQEMQNETTLKKWMEQYVKLEYISSECFQPLSEG